ncbi:unnamed protein product [Prunus armeniaca]
MGPQKSVTETLCCVWGATSLVPPCMDNTTKNVHKALQAIEQMQLTVREPEHGRASLSAITKVLVAPWDIGRPAQRIKNVKTLNKLNSPLTSAHMYVLQPRPSQ